LQAFDYVRAQSVDEVVSLLSQNGDQARILSGGTDLIVAIREGRRSAKVVIDVKGLPETSQIEYSAQSGLKFGASVPCYRLYQNKEVATAYAGLMDSAHLIGGIQIQGRASIGGNLCNASPAADSIPTLIAYSTICVIAGPNGVRELPVEEFCIAPGRNALQNGEFLLSLKLPPVKAGSGASYLRFIPRNEMDIAVVGAGAYVELDEGRNNFVAARVSLGAVAPKPLFIKEAGDSLVGKPVNAANIEAAAKIAQAAATPITDMRGTAEYRKHLSAVMARRAIEKAVTRARGI
jgi:CO/xanthine dehydrogenase FAD-binding subunit